MAASKLCLFISAILLALAGIIIVGGFKDISPEAVALFGFAFWAVSGAV